MTEMDRLDAQSFGKAINMENAGKEGRERISDMDFARFCAPRGGCKHGHIWGYYRLGKRRIPARDKLLAALFLEHDPGDVFPSLKEFPMWDLLRTVIKRYSTAENLLFSEMLGLIVTIPEDERRPILRQLKEL
jgi:hypothetical protein